MDGFSSGLITAGLNHALHSLSDIWQVDRDLKKLGLIPSDKAPYSLESISKIEELDGIQKLLNITTKANVMLDAIDGKSYYLNGTIGMAERDFKTWRRLATAYGHEVVHRINDMKYMGIWVTNKVSGSKYYFNEVLAHSWSTAYSGVPYNFLDKAISKSGQLYINYFKSQVILP